MATDLFNLSLIWLDSTVLHLCKFEYNQLVDVVLELNLKIENQTLSTFIILKIMNFILLFIQNFDDYDLENTNLNSDLIHPNTTGKKR